MSFKPDNVQVYIRSYILLKPKSIQALQIGGFVGRPENIGE
jgi:hypothetical protein